ncbi:MAG: MarR family winged helix-turn-helix transcriptional regulator [Thermocrispum sp.]
MPAPRPPSLLALPSYLASYTAGYGRALIERELATRDLKLVHNAVLIALDDFGPRSQQELSDSLRIDKSHLVKYVDTLEARGLLRREPDADDRRRHRVTLTPAGDKLASELQSIGRRSQQGFLDALSAHEQRTLVDLLARVLEDNDQRASRSDPLPRS